MMIPPSLMREELGEDLNSNKDRQEPGAHQEWVLYIIRNEKGGPGAPK
jgi:hypothetical protein